MKILAFAIFYLIVSSSVYASEPEVLRGFFGHDGIKNKSTLYIGEMLQHAVNEPTLGDNLPKDVKSTYRKLYENKNKSIYAVFLSDGQQSQDWYAYLERENQIWKLSAVRKLALPGMYFMALQEIESKKSRSEEEEWQYQNMLLTIKSDKELKEYLKSKLVDFNEIISLYLDGKKDQYEIKLKRLFISNITANSGVIELSIGGIMDNSVGYMYVKPGNSPPKMSPSEFIYIEQISKGWYIYKTT